MHKYEGPQKIGKRWGPTLVAGLWTIYSVETERHAKSGADPGFAVSRVRIGPERTGTAFRFFFLNRNGVPVHFLEKSERKSDSCCCVHTSVLPSVAVLKLRLGLLAHPPTNLSGSLQ